MIQACRESGSATQREADDRRRRGRARARRARRRRSESLVSIPISGPMDFARLEALGLNLDEVPNNGKAIAVLEGPPGRREDHRRRLHLHDADARTWRRAERGYRAREQAAAAAGSRPRCRPGAPPIASTPTSRPTSRRSWPTTRTSRARSRSRRRRFQGRDITGIEVTDNVGAADDGKPIFFLMGEHHAREWPSAEIPVEMGLYLTNNFGKRRARDRAAQEGAHRDRAGDQRGRLHRLARRGRPRRQQRRPAGPALARRVRGAPGRQPRLPAQELRRREPRPDHAVRAPVRRRPEPQLRPELGRPRCRHRARTTRTTAAPTSGPSPRRRPCTSSRSRTT